MRISAIASLALVALTAGVLAASAAPASSGTVVSWRPTSIGNAITTKAGHTLYLFRADHGTTSACYGSCATYWPPLLTASKPVASGA
jgi:predicted lipoprotein with Yx(FWY)xxD motif